MIKYFLKYKFYWQLTDGRSKDIFSLVLFGFPIFVYKKYNFKYPGITKIFANDEDWENVHFFWFMGFLIFTKAFTPKKDII